MFGSTTQGGKGRLVELKLLGGRNFRVLRRGRSGLGWAPRLPSKERKARQGTEPPGVTTQGHSVYTDRTGTPGREGRPSMNVLRLPLPRSFWVFIFLPVPRVLPSLLLVRRRGGRTGAQLAAHTPLTPPYVGPMKGLWRGGSGKRVLRRPQRGRDRRPLGPYWDPGSPR